ncbi:hypothetical protein AB0F77_28960 [Streptomyces sp. NPDC026672]|uniref:hypothetical protein n=1 Tax=unclassified Streptomyces TaxID=2593676 RepID=UPI0033C10884
MTTAPYRYERPVSVLDAINTLSHDPGAAYLAGGTTQLDLVLKDGVDVTFVGRPDRMNPVGVKGMGEAGIAGVPAALANAIFHATGRRVRKLPITVEDLM